MHLSIKQKQVLGVTSIVAMVVIALSVLQLATLARVLLEQSGARADMLANGVVHQAREVLTSRETAYQDIRSSRSVLAALESAIYSPNVIYAAIVDHTGTIVASSDPARVGSTLEHGGDLAALMTSGNIKQVQAVYAEGSTLEWRQPLLLGDQPFGEIRIGLSAILVREELDRSLRPALLAAGLALIVAVLVAMLLAQVVVRPIHVITSGLSRLGRGELGATLDLREDEFRDLGDVFDIVSAQLRASAPDDARRSQVADLSRRVAAIGRLTAGVAHEVKNPLNAMAIHLELLKQKLDSPQPMTAAPHAEVIGSEIKRLDQVVQGFLRFVRPEDVAVSSVSVERLVSSVAAAVAPEAEAGRVHLEAVCADPELSVEGDEASLRQALLNLAQNAIHAMPKGGRLRISGSLTRDGRAEIRVADTGSGIAPEHLERIFDLYFTTKARGSGIGLSLVYRTVQFHNGDIDVESTVGKGTTFVIKLPLAR